MRRVLPAAIALGLGLAAAPAGAGVTTSTVPVKPVRAVVLVKPGVTLPLAVRGGRVLAVLTHIGAEVVTAAPASLDALASDSRVLGVSPDAPGHPAGNDSAAGQGVLAAQALGGGAGLAKTGAGVSVALIDTGVTDTAALNRASGRLVDGVDVSQLATGGDAQTSGVFADGYGHGTFLASLIAGGKVRGSGNRALGIAPAAHVVVVKVADDQGNTYLSQVLAGMDWVAVHHSDVQVANIALGVDRPTGPAYGADPLAVAVEHLRAAGVLVVAAAGNTPGQVGDPGLDPQALTVGAAELGRTTRVASFSGSGNVAGVAKPDLVAPGMHVLGLVARNSLIAQDNPTGWTTSGLFLGSGTSEATAIVAGTAAAYLSGHRNTSPVLVKAALRSAARKLKDARAGAGFVRLVNGKGPKPTVAAAGESGFDSASWTANAWQGIDNWQSLLEQSWSAGSWSAGSWSAGSWSAGSWSAGSWSAGSWSAGSWSAGSWSASSWSSYRWGRR